MSLKCGIVGLPNVGKSTLFNALTKAGVAAENYPFCTIDPSVGIVEVPDKRLDKLSEIVKPQRVVPVRQPRRQRNGDHPQQHRRRQNNADGRGVQPLGCQPDR